MPRPVEATEPNAVTGFGFAVSSGVADATGDADAPGDADGATGVADAAADGATADGATGDGETSPPLGDEPAAGESSTPTGDVGDGCAAVLPVCAGDGRVGSPKAPTASATAARRRLRIPRATTSRAR
jgi:hypothetical protein